MVLLRENNLDLTLTKQNTIAKSRGDALALGLLHLDLLLPLVCSCAWLDKMRRLVQLLTVVTSLSMGSVSQVDATEKSWWKAEQKALKQREKAHLGLFWNSGVNH